MGMTAWVLRYLFLHLAMLRKMNGCSMQVFYCTASVMIFSL